MNKMLCRPLHRVFHQNDILSMHRLFSNGEIGGYWPVLPAYLFSDVEGTVIAASGNTVAYRKNAIQNGSDAIQTESANRPHLRQAPSGRYYIDRSAALRSLTVTFPVENLYSRCTIIKNTIDGVVIRENQSVDNQYELTQEFGYNGDIFIIDRVMTEEEKTTVTAIMQRNCIVHNEIPQAVFDVYCDSVAGNDANNGLTIDTPKATLSATKTLALSIGNGVKVGLKRGSKWLETLSITTLTGVVLCGYGDKSLPLPCIEGRDVATTWAKEDGYTNVYKKLWTTNFYGASSTVKHKITAFEDGAYLVWVSSIALCDATPGTYFVNSTTDMIENEPVYIHATGSGNPDTNGKNYQLTKRANCCQIGSNSYCSDIWTIGQGNHDGSFTSGNYNSVNRVLSSYGVVHNLWVGAGSAANDCVAYQCRPNGNNGSALNATLFITYDTSPAVSYNTTYNGCYAYHDISHAGVSNAHIGIYSHTGGATNLYKMYVNGCFVGGLNIAGSNTDYSVIKNCLGRRNLTGVILNGQDNCFSLGGTKGNVIDNCVALFYGRAFLGMSKCVASDLRAHCIPASGGVLGPSPMQLTDSSFSTEAGYTLFIWGPNVRAFQFKNNAVKGFSEYHLYTASKEYPITDYNVFPGNRFYSNDTFYSLSEWSIETGQDVHSVVGDPGFVDPANNDWTIPANSVCNTGGRKAGSRKHIVEPDWAALKTQWESGFIGF